MAYRKHNSLLVTYTEAERKREILLNLPLQSDSGA